MGETEKNTLDTILSAAKAEFLEKGFKSASLRNIVKTAGVITGAFYGYYKSKEELFDALVSKQYHTFMGMFTETQNAFSKLSPEEQMAGMGKLSGEGMRRMMDYAYAHKDIFKLLLCSSEGTKYENMLHDIVKIEVDATHRFADIMEKSGYAKYAVDPVLEHMLVSGLFSAFFEVIIHDVPYEKAPKYLKELRDFYTAGWQKIMGF